MIPGPLLPAQVTQPQSWRSEAESAEAAHRVRVTGGIALIAVGILAVVAWGIFLSPFGFSRFPLAAQYRTFSARQAGTYAVYLEYPGETHPTLPPALDIEVSPLSGQRVDVRMIGKPGVYGAPDSYHVGRYEGRAVALVTVHHSGAFLLSVTAKREGQFDPNQLLPVTEGTIAVGRGFGLGWPTTQWCGLVLFFVPTAAGAVLLLSSRRPRPLR